VPEGILRETAIKTAEFTMLFWNALVAYIEDEYQQDVVGNEAVGGERVMPGGLITWGRIS
jgi:hypothetical protein